MEYFSRIINSFTHGFSLIFRIAGFNQFLQISSFFNIFFKSATANCMTRSQFLPQSYHFIYYNSQIMQRNKFNPRVAIFFRSSLSSKLYLASMGLYIHLFPHKSYLHILNSVELIKVNTSSSQELKLGQSFYVYFHLTDQYLSYHEQQNKLCLTRVLAERTLFKIISDKNDWKNQGKIITSHNEATSDLLNTKYRIILAQYSSKYLTFSHFNIQVSSIYDSTIEEIQKSYTYFENSIYFDPQSVYPLRFVGLENSLILAHYNWKIISKTKIGAHASMFTIQSEPENKTHLKAIKHVESGLYLTLAGSQILLGKKLDMNDLYIFDIHSYDENGNYAFLRAATGDGFKNIICTKENEKCEIGNESLMNLMKKQFFIDEELKSITPFAWLKAELETSHNQENINFILEELISLVEDFYEVYSHEALRNLVQEGLLLALQQSIRKYQWQKIGHKIFEAIFLMLQVDSQILSDLLGVEKIYLNLLQNSEFQHKAHETTLNSSIKDYQILENASNLILAKKQITIDTLETIIILSEIFTANQQLFYQNANYQQIINLIDSICQQSVHQLNRKFITNKYILGIQIILAHKSEEFICSKVLPNLSLQAITHDKSILEDNLDLIKIFQRERPPYLYVATDIGDFHQEVEDRIKIFNKATREFIINYIDDSLPKNVRFQTYECKVLCLSLCRLVTRYKFGSLDSFECKKWMKLVVENIGNLKNSGYEEQKYGCFILEGLKSLRILLQFYAYLLCEQSIKYDSITVKLQDKVEKALKEFDEIGSIDKLFGDEIWSILAGSQSSFNLYSYSQKNILRHSNLDGSFMTQDTLGAALLIILDIGACITSRYNSQATYFIKNLYSLHELTNQFQTLMTMFINKQYEYNWTLMAKFILETNSTYTQAQYSSIIMTIHKNDLYQWICKEHNDICYRALSELAIANERGYGGLFDGIKLLKLLFGRGAQENERRWIQTDCEFILLRNILYLIGGVVSEEVYVIFEEYICYLPPQKWSISFLRLCQCFFSLSPQILRMNFSINYQQIVFKKVDPNKMRVKLKEEGEQFLLGYVSILCMLSNYHSNKILVYNMIGDTTLFEFLQTHELNNQLKITVLEFMIKTRIKKYQETGYYLEEQDYEWLKYGTAFIRRQTVKATSMRNSEFMFLKEYTYAMIDFLKMREDMLEDADFLENEVLMIEGTNKLCAFQIADFIELTLSTEQISRDIIDKIQWFQSTYKINVNSLQLTRITIDPPEMKIKPQNFSYTYLLQVNQNLQETVKMVETRFGLSNFITLLLRLLSAYTINLNDRHSDQVELILHYLHFIVTKRSYNYIQKQVSALFLAMQQHMRFKKYKEVAIIQNIIRKAIWKDGKIETKNQEIVQGLVLENKDEICDYFSHFIDRYLIFTPLYSKNSSYFTKRAEDQISWVISEYICLIRFMICLTKSLNLKFKSIFAESSVFKKQLVAKIISATEKNCEILQDPSKIRLTIITYELDLLNSLILGPEQNNISSVLKLEYHHLIIQKLMVLPDYSGFTSFEQEEKYKIILKMKQIISETLFTLADFICFSLEETKIIEEALVLYYQQSCKLYKSPDFDKIIVSYSKKNKGSLAVKSFDLALHLFYAIIKIYEKQDNMTVKKIKAQQLQEIRLVKSYNKRFKMFYQIYRLTAEVFIWLGNLVYKCCHQTANQMHIDEVSNFFDNIGNTHEQRIKTVYKFFAKHVSNVQIQVGEKRQTVFYLLLKQAQCYNASIRKEFHRKIGLGTREYRLSKFMQISNHIVLRLQVEKSIKSFTQKYKPFDIIIKNRQLWKSMNFLCACLLNTIFLQLHVAEDSEIPQNILRSLSYLFCIFLFIIYFIQNLPLKRKLAAIYAQDTKRSKLRYIKSCLQIFNDKTLWFASIYFIILSLSFYELGFVSLLMVDFFVRFKISKKVTQIVTRPIGQLFLIIVLSVQVAFVYTCYLYFINESIDCPDTATCIQNTYKTYLGINKNEILPIQSTTLTFRNVTSFLFAFFNIFVTMSLIIGVLLYEKKAKDIKTKDWEFQLKKKCFICDTERSEIDRHRNNNQGFFEHIEEEHNLWSYMFYLVYLKNKEVQSMNVIENMVMEEWARLGIEWLPVTYEQSI